MSDERLYPDLTTCVQCGIKLTQGQVVFCSTCDEEIDREEREHLRDED